MPRTPDTPAGGPAWLVQAAEIARLFYFDGQSKVQIADQLGLSRFKVARILDEARERGLVEVTMRFPTAIDVDGSVRLAHHLGTERAVVLDSEAVDDRSRGELGGLAAQLLTEIVTGADVLGLTCSRMVTATTHSLTSLAACDVVQLTGTLAGMGPQVGSVESVRHAAVVGGGTAYQIYAPLIVGDAETARSLAQQPAIRATLDRIPDVTVALVSIGAWRADHSTVWDAVSDAEREKTSAAGRGRRGRWPLLRRRRPGRVRAGGRSGGRDDARAAAVGAPRRRHRVRRRARRAGAGTRRGRRAALAGLRLALWPPRSSPCLRWPRRRRHDVGGGSRLLHPVDQGAGVRRRHRRGRATGQDGASRRHRGRPAGVVEGVR